MLTIENLSFERENRLLLSDIHFSLKKGELIQITGANGSGKSTLLRIIAGFIEPLRGCVYWENQPIARNRENFQQQLHYLGHQSGVKYYLTVQENLSMQCALAGNKSYLSDISKILERLKLTPLLHHQAGTLSAGQLRKLALARLSLNPVSLWILDEPTAALDSSGQDVLIEMVKEHVNQGGLGIVATHQELPSLTISQTIKLEDCHV